MTKVYKCKLGGLCSKAQCPYPKYWRKCEYLEIAKAPLPKKNLEKVKASPRLTGGHWSSAVANLLMYAAFCWFLAMTFYHTDPTGLSWVLYHLKDLYPAYGLIVIALPFHIYGLTKMRR